MHGISQGAVGLPFFLVDCCLQVAGKVAPTAQVAAVAPHLALLRTKGGHLLLLRGEAGEGPSSTN